MTNPDPRPTEELISCGEDITVELIPPREVPLGGPRAMTVRRTLPARSRSLIGAWCFLDHYGPDRIAETGGMHVPPHPHIGLQTVSWLFTGEVEHRDSTGVHAMVVPGEFNLMTGGRGISHSEISTSTTEILHGVQLWVALPAEAKDTDPGFEHYVPTPVTGQGWEARVFLGSLLGDTSPVRTFTPLLGAELRLEAGTSLTLEVDPAYEHGLLLDSGSLRVGPDAVAPGELLYLGTGQQQITVTAHETARIVVLGGPPFGEQILMWWNFVGRAQEEITQAREEWQAQLHRDGELVSDSTEVNPGRFGIVPDQHLAPLPAPVLPNVTLRPRG